MDSFYRLEDIDTTAAEFLQNAGSHRVLAFHGEMGTGKTTFIKAICKQLGVTGAVSSPTYSIINQYAAANGKTVYHLDLYRLKDEEEALQAGVEECFFSGEYCLVEWPDKTPGLLPENTLHCYLSNSGNNERKLKIKM
jgi:tRNA threonylcarbamoyladenosine biosynthesis protein TsaE